jgi:hypothetical protein
MWMIKHSVSRRRCQFAHRLPLALEPDLFRRCSEMARTGARVVAPRQDGVCLGVLGCSGCPEPAAILSLPDTWLEQQYSDSSER